MTGPWSTEVLIADLARQMPSPILVADFPRACEIKTDQADSARRVQGGMLCTRLDGYSGAICITLVSRIEWPSAGQPKLYDSSSVRAGLFSGSDAPVVPSICSDSEPSSDASCSAGCNSVSGDVRTTSVHCTSSLPLTQSCSTTTFEASSSVEPS